MKISSTGIPTDVWRTTLIMGMESRIQKLIDRDIEFIVPWYLMLSYGYYCLDESIVSDSFYDSLAQKFLKNYDRLSHRHVKLIKKEDLKAGTLYSLAEDDYPLIAKSSYLQVTRDIYTYDNEHI